MPTISQTLLPTLPWKHDGILPKQSWHFAKLWRGTGQEIDLAGKGCLIFLAVRKGRVNNEKTRLTEFKSP